jgi:hypothetical protein
MAEIVGQVLGDETEQPRPRRLPGQIEHTPVVPNVDVAKRYFILFFKISSFFFTEIKMAYEN